MQHATRLAFAFSIAASLALASLVSLGACGSSKNSNGDANSGGDSGPADGPVDAPLPACDYTEAADSTNATMPENAGVTVGTITRTLCGQVDMGHFGSGSTAVDVDAYTVMVASGPVDLIVQFENATPASLTDFQVVITDTMTNATLINGGHYTGALSDHGAFLSELPTGNYNIVVTATGSADVAAAIPYKVRLAADQPTVRCGDLTGMPADYTEAGDGASNTGNDVVDADFSKNPAFTLTAATTDAPEMTGLSLLPHVTKHLVGSSAAVAAGTDKYLDRDTFALMTGANTNELSIRLNWPGATADLDYVVFPASTITTPNQVSTLTAMQQDEFATFAVQPNTTYWLWIGAYAGSTGAPIAYSASVCGGRFAP